jgi:hypothetical protein
MPNRARDHVPASALECKTARTLADAIALALD